MSAFDGWAEENELVKINQRGRHKVRIAEYEQYPGEREGGHSVSQRARTAKDWLALFTVVLVEGGLWEDCSGYEGGDRSSGVEGEEKQQNYPLE